MPLRCKVFARINNCANCDEADVSFVQTQKNAKSLLGPSGPPYTNFVASLRFVHKKDRPTSEIPRQKEVIAGGVLDFHFGIGVRPKGRKWGLKERVGSKNKGLKNWFWMIELKELNFWKK